MTHRTFAVTFALAGALVVSPLGAQGAAPTMPRGATAGSAPLAVSLLKDVTGSDWTTGAWRGPRFHPSATHVALL